MTNTGSSSSATSKRPDCQASIRISADPFTGANEFEPRFCWFALGRQLDAAGRLLALREHAVLARHGNHSDPFSSLENPALQAVLMALEVPDNPLPRSSSIRLLPARFR
jgi:hypothetical protein